MHADTKQYLSRKIIAILIAILQCIFGFLDKYYHSRLSDNSVIIINYCVMKLIN